MFVNSIDDLVICALLYALAESCVVLLTIRNGCSHHMQAKLTIQQRYSVILCGKDALTF
jgi:hypothetical protein